MTSSDTAVLAPANQRTPTLVRPDPALWDLPDIRAALAVRDITTLFGLLCQRHGLTQRRLAALVGMSQSEISEIIKGRQVRFYDVFARIAQGLGIPRGYLGLAESAPAPGAGADNAAESTPEARRLAPDGRRRGAGRGVPRRTRRPRPRR